MTFACSSVVRQLQVLADSKKAAFFPRFFKTGKGQYGEGDRFLGITVPNVRSVAQKYGDATDEDIETLLVNPYHEVRMLALMILMHQYESAKESARKKQIVDFYIAHRANINNWDLVDLSAYKILGDYLLTKDRKILYRFAKTPHLWTQRIAIVSTFAFIRAGQFDETLKIAEIFLEHPHDLMHKAVGWMLREVGKRDEKVLRRFLDQHAHAMPRTMLRYAIERFDTASRQSYLHRQR
jgi:3-methyladenine DNA glycosylase AlkD